MPTDEEIRLCFPDDELDNVSVASTSCSEERDTYELEEILAEDTFEEEVKDESTGETRVEQFKGYLIKWTGYDIHEANYERVEQLAEGYDDTIHNWQTRKMRISRGVEEPFDVETWEAECRDINYQKYIRQKRRREKRRRLNLPLGRDPDEDPLNVEFVPAKLEDSSDDDAPLASRRKRAAAEESSDDEVPLAQKRRKDTAQQTRESRDPKTTDSERRKKKGQAVTVQKTNQQTAKQLPNSVTRRSPARSAQKTKTPQPATTSATTWFDAFSSRPQGNRIAGSTNHNKPADLRAQPRANGTAMSQPSIRPVPPTGPKMGPASHVGKKLGSTVRKSAGPSILDNWDSKKPEPKRKLTSTVGEVRRCPTLQLQNIVRKAGKKDIAPPLEDSQLLSAGRKGSAITDRPSTGRVNNGNMQSKLASLGISTNPSEVESPENPAGGADFKMAQHRPLDLELLSCYFWSSQLPCHFGRECIFEHNNSYPTAPVNNTLNKNQATCWYWFTNPQGCNKRPEICRFSHYMTRYLGPSMGKTAPRRLGLHERPRWMVQEDDSVQKSTSNAQAQNTSTLPGNQNMDRPPEDTYNLGCWFHNFGPGGCNKSVSECKFLHQIVPWVASRTFGPPIFNTKAYNRTEPPTEAINPGTGSDEGLPMDLDEPPTRDSPSPPPRPSRGKESASIPAPGFTFTQHVLPSRTSAIPRRDSGILPIRVNLQFPQKSPNASNVAREISLSGFTEKSRAQFQTELERYRLPPVSHICSAEDMKYSFAVDKHQKYADGDISSANPSEPWLSNFEENLRVLQSSAIIFHPQFTMFLYPISILGEFFKPSTEGSSLRFHICSPLSPPPSDISNAPEGTRNKPEVLTKPYTIEPISGLSSKQLFSWGNSGEKTEKDVFLVFHPRHEDISLEVKECLQKIGAKIYHSSTPGAWNYFSNAKRSGVVIFQSEFDSFKSMENFSKLAQTTSRFNFFRLTTYAVDTDNQSPTDALSPASPATPLAPISPFSPAMAPSITLSAPQRKHCLQRILPHGLAVYIMDDCFVYQPHDTRPALQRIFHRVSHSSSITRVLGRPGLLPWLRELAAAEEHSSKPAEPAQLEYNHSRPDRPIAELYNLLTLINNTSKKKRPPTDNAPMSLDSDSESEDEGNKPICAIPHWQMPDYAELWRKDEAAASNRMAHWFSGWSVQQVGEIRRFVVLSMVGSGLREEWKRKYRHLSVLTPGDFERQEQPPKR